VERYEVFNTFLKPADLVLQANLSLLQRAGVLAPLQDGVYWAAQRLLRLNFEAQNDLEVRGLEHVPAGGVILASNHQSWDDVQALAAVFPRRIHFMAKEEFRRWPIMRQMIELSRSFYIDRTGADRSGFTSAIEFLDAGESVAMFPEGTIPGEEDVARSAVQPATALLRGRTGVIRLAILSGCPIVPVGVSGSSSAFPPEMFPRLEVPPLPRREKITLSFGEPFYPDPENRFGRQLPDSATLRQLTDTLMTKISDLVDHHRQYVPLARFTPELLQAAPGDEQRLGVLLLHGFTSHVKCVSGVVPYLEKHGIPYRMPILAGHGQTPADMVGVRWPDWVRDAATALDELRQTVDRVVVIGLSMGALVALELAVTRPDDVAGVVAVAPAIRFANPLAPLAGAISKVIRYFPSPKAYHDKERAKGNENYLKFPTATFASLVEFAKELEGRLDRIRCPVRLIHSHKDQVAAPAGAELILEKLTTADKELIWFNRSGHEMLLDLEAEAVFPLIEEFVLQRRHALRPTE
jgi:carboxylesterase